MKKWIAKNYKNYLCLLVVFPILGIVSVLFNNSNFGSDSIFCLNQGVANALNLPLGVVNILLNLLFLIIMLIINRKAVGVGTVLMMAVLGLFIDLMMMLNFIPNLALLKDSIHPIIYVCLQVLYIFAGIILGGFAISLYIYANRGIAPFEGVLMKISEVTRIPFWACKIINDVIFYIIGFVCGGVIGIGSIIAATLYGPSISLFGKMWKKIDFLGENKNEETK